MRRFNGLPAEDKILGVIATKLSSMFLDYRASRYTEPQVIADDLQYNLTGLMAEMITNLEFRFPDILEVQSVIEEYNNANGTTFSFDYYFRKGWLRIINDEIRIPVVICRALFPILSPEHYKNNPVIPEPFASELQCLSRVKRLLDERQRLTIAEDVLNGILLKYSPRLDIQFLIDKEIIKEHGEKTYQWLEHNDYGEHLCDRLASLLWLKIKGDSPTVAEFRKFIRVIMHCLRMWPSNLPDFLSAQDVKDLHRFSMEMLNAEKDLANLDIEVRNYFLDSELHMDHKFDTAIPELPFIAKSSFELIQEIEDFSRTFHDFFYHEHSRTEYLLLIRFIVELDTDFNQTYTAVKKVLKNTEKPFLVFSAFSSIKRSFPEVIPFLLQDAELASMAFLLLEEIEIDTSLFPSQERDDAFEQGEKARDEVWSELFNVLLNKASKETHPQAYSKALTETLYVLVQNVFQFNSNNYSYSLIKHRILKERYDKVIKELETRRIERTNHYPQPRIKPYLIKHILKDLITRLLDIPDHIHRNEYLSLKTGQLDLLIEFLGLAEKEYKADESHFMPPVDFDPLKDEISDLIFEHLKTYFQTDFIDVVNYFKPLNDKKQAVRGVDDFGIEIVDWGLCYAHLQRIGKLEDLDGIVKTSLVFSIDKNKYDPQNKEQVTKIQVYLRTLLIAFIQLGEKVSDYELRSFDTKSLMNRLAGIIEFYAITYSVEKPSESRFDIFDEQFHFFNANPYSITLRALLYRSINYLPEEKAKEFINHLFSESNDLERLLKAINTIENKKVSAQLADKVRQVDIDKFINSKHSITDIESALIEAVNSREHFTLAERLLITIENHFESRRIKTPDVRSLLYRVKLLLALKNKDIKALTATEVPKEEHVYPNRNKTEEYRKKFYLALFEMNVNNDYHKAISMLEELHSNEPKNTEYSFHLYKARVYKNLNNG